MTDVPIETSVMRTSWSAAHKPRFREYQVFQEATREGQSTRKRAMLSFKAYSTSSECCTHSNTSAACPRRRMTREISSSEGSFFVDSGFFAVVVLPSSGPTLGFFSRSSCFFAASKLFLLFNDSASSSSSSALSVLPFWFALRAGAGTASASSPPVFSHFDHLMRGAYNRRRSCLSWRFCTSSRECFSMFSI